MAEPHVASGPVSGRRLWFATLAIFLFALLLFGWLFSRSPLLYDTDAYYHLTVARAQAEEGLDHPFPWTRFGLLARGFGDKEVLFHLFLAPFTVGFEPATGGRVALALLDALLLAGIGHLSLRAVGLWGALVPFWLVLSATQFTWRLVRLRPELFALGLLLAAIWLAARGKHRWVGLLAALFALSYTAIHAFAGLFVLLFLAVRWVERRWEWPLLLYPLLGSGVGLVVHPDFPHHLVVWWFVAVEFFLLKGTLDVGSEIRPVTTEVALLANLGWWLGMALLWRCGREGSSARSGQGGKEPSPSRVPEGVAPDTDGRTALFFGVSVLVFGGLALLMSRFALYAIPLATVWLLFELRRRGRLPGPRTELGGGRRIPTAVGWAVCLLAALPIARQELGRYLQRVDPGPDRIRLADRRDLAWAIPPAARVAAPWGVTPIYMFEAPQGRYLNVLDPGLLAVADPEVHRAQEAIFEGEEPDVPAVTAGVLESDYLAYNASRGRELLTRRLEGDPRVETVHRRLHALFRLRPVAPGTFVLGWRLAPPGVGAARIDSSRVDSWPVSGGAAAAEGALAGWVDASSSPSGSTVECRTFARRLTADEPWSGAFEFAPYGRGELWLDGRIVAQVRSEPLAILGEGVLLPLELGSGEHLLAVVTCPSRAPPHRSGFYLLRRSGRPSEVQS